MSVETREVLEDYNSRSNNTTKDGNHKKENEELATPTTPPGQLKCSICQSTFRRPEHLRRHVRSHTKEKPFKCEHCGRCFSRTDTLHRHEVSHHTQGPDGERERVYRINVSTFRACVKCAVARVRCSGGTPCDRCRNKTLACEYPKERKSKIRAMRKATQTSVATEERREVNTTPEQTNEDQSHANINDVSPISTTQSHHRYGSFENSSISPIGTQPPNFINHAVTQTNNPSIPTTIPHDLEPSTLSPVRDHNYSNIGSQQLYSTPSTHNFAVPLHVRTDSASDKYSYKDANSPTALNTSMNMALSNPTSNPLQINFDPNLFDQSVLSAINWLPMDLFDGTSGDMGLAQGDSPSLPDTWSADSHLRSLWMPPTANSEHIPSSCIPGDILQDSRNLASAQMRNNMGQYANEPSEGSSQAGSLEGTVSSGEYYIDGDGARLPKYKRRCKAWSKTSQDQISQLALIQSGHQNRSFGFPNIDHIPADSKFDEFQPKVEIDRSTYDTILDSFRQTCRRGDISLFPEFYSEFFPSINILTEFVRFYFDSFQPLYPIFHVPTFDPNKCHWVLTLSLAAVGCHFAEYNGSDKCARAIHEFLRRAIFVENEISSSKARPLWLTQATVLNCIGMLYSGDENLKLSAFKSFSNIASSSKCEQLFYQPKHSVARNRQMIDWDTWIGDEVARRTGYFIWLLDCAFVYDFDKKPSMTLEDAQAPLPCQDDLWLASSEESWRHLYSKHSDGLSLYSAIQILYVEKRLVPDIGEFSHVLLLHAIYQRTWEVSDYFRRPLSNWTPNARKETQDSVVPNGSVWLPAIPVYSKWRNSACDCLDVLHWAANGTIAKASGLEHPTVLHLHFGRVVLLVPYKEMRTMATSLSRGTINWGEHETCVEWQYIWRWAKHDQHKARLSIIHAGALLWHVRRYSTNAFHEPVAIFLATLTLWAYGYCTRALKQQPIDSTENRLEPDPSAPLPPNPTFVHLDRPCDDELVQLFVREGHTMQGNVTSVGDICGPNGPERVLKVGAGILAGLTMNWGLSNDLNIILTRLADQTSSSPVSN